MNLRTALGRPANFRSAREIARMLPQGRLGGPMPWVIAIMVSLTTMAVAAGMALNNAAGSALNEIEGGLTVQIVEGAPAARAEQAEQVMAFFESRSDVADVRRVPEAELEQLLEPWLGEAARDEDGLVTPALIDVRINGAITADALRTMRAELAQVAPAARLDAQANWLAPVFDALRSLQWLALGLVLLLAATTTAAVWLAARSALGINQDTIALIHHLGGTDGQIAGIFQRSIAADAAVGGVAGLMLGLAAIFLLGQQFAALGSGLVAGGGLTVRDWIAVLAVPLIVLALAVLTARLTVLDALRRTL